MAAPSPGGGSARDGRATRSGRSRSEPPSRLSVVVTVAVLLLLPVGLAVAVGWYGVNPRAAEALTPVGGYAHELLNGFPDGRLTVEVAAPPGELPPESALGTLSARMNETLQKGSISFQLETYSADSRGALSTDQLLALEDQVRTTWPEPGSMSLFYLFVDGTYAGGSDVLGLAYRGSSIAVFPNVVTGGAPPSSQSAVFATVLVHEFGHELGLVGLVGSAPNEDPAHPGHSDDPNDVMYWQVETTGVLGGLLPGGGPPTQFDAADLSDLSTVRSTPIVDELLPWVVLGVVVVAALAVAVYARRARRRGSP